ncbi:hypothetical protein RIEGSTA812A_PEG_698 [invertebrate metagenome]|uniref:Uncharacterized protein n=1 Tax=invertebrate metagenome TaxID=1711999 RepID=A0A484H729_9ZZZZ
MPATTISGYNPTIDCQITLAEAPTTPSFRRSSFPPALICQCSSPQARRIRQPYPTPPHWLTQCRRMGLEAKIIFYFLEHDKDV